MENRVKEYLRETIVKDCQVKECGVSGDLVEFLLNLLLLNPEYNSVKEDTCQTDLASIVTAVTTKLLNQNRPSLVLLKLQLYFNKHYVPRDEVILKHRKCIYTKSSPLLKEICNTTLQKGGEQEIEKLYQKMVIYIILLSGLGNPSIPGVLREGNVALQSVYRLSELTHFVTMPLEKKESQLTELMCIVAGIRLFNRDLQRGGEGIEDLPSVLQEAVAKTQTSTMHVLEKIMNKVYNFTAALDRTISLSSEDEEISSNPSRQWPADINGEEIEWAVEMLAAGRQQEVYVRKLLDDIERCECNVKNLMEKLQTRFLKLHGSIHSRTAIPTVEIYPQFIDLTNTWMQLQDEVVVLSNVNTFLWEMQSMTIKNLDTYDDLLVGRMIDDGQILTDAERLEERMGKMITEAGECEIFYPNVTKDFDQIHVEYLGFCAWSFAEGIGALIPGNPNIGVVKWNGKYFAFSSREAASKFGANPSRFVNEAIEIVYNNPEYVNLLQIYEDMKPVRVDREESIDESSDPKVVKDQEVQTDLHPLESNIVKSYTSSMWEYRRRALQLAEICRSVTHGTQTYKSNFRSDIYTYVAPRRDQEIQTMRENYANTNKLKKFIYGLRGRRDDQQHVLSLENNTG